MRYTHPNKVDWVEFKPGTGRLSMREVMGCLDLAGRAELFAQIDKGNFVNRHGEAVALAAPDDLFGLTFQQHAWLAEKLVEWSRDDTLDPEA